jgi:hypothetical protein
LQRKIADTVEGYRQETIRMAAKWMKPVLSKQIKVALEGDGETSRKCREFLLKTFMLAIPDQAAKTPAKPMAKPPPDSERQLDGVALYNSLMELSPDLKDQVIKELGGPTDERHSATEYTESADVEKTTARGERLSTTDSTDDADVEKATVLVSPSSTAPPLADPLPTATPLDKGKKKVLAPFANLVDGPHGKKVYAASIRAIEEAKAEEAARPTRRRVPRSPR